MHAALQQLGLKIEVEIIGDMRKIRATGVEFTPAVFLEEQLLIQGKTPSLAEMVKLIENCILKLNA